MPIAQRYIALSERGVMLPDYFSGTPGIMLTVPVDSSTTVRQVLDELENCINTLSDLIETYFDDWRGSNDISDIFEDLYGQLMYMRGYVDGREIGEKPYAYDLEPLDECTGADTNDTPVAIFTIEPLAGLY